MKSHYTPDEADAILNSAIRERPMPGDMTRDNLVAVAEEMGISPEELAAAERKWQGEIQETQVNHLRMAFDKERRLKRILVLGVLSFVAISAAAGGDGFSPSVLFMVVSMLLLAVLVKWVRLHGSAWEDAAFERWLNRRHRTALLTYVTSRDRLRP